MQRFKNKNLRVLLLYKTSIKTNAQIFIHKKYGRLFSFKIKIVHKNIANLFSFKIKIVHENMLI